MLPFAIYLCVVFAYSVVSARLDRTIVTAPILFAVFGVLSFVLIPPMREVQAETEVFRRVAEAGLVLLLFADASRTPLDELRSLKSFPIRLLTVGMLLSIVLGTVAAKLVFPQLTIWEAGILGAILAPTDAGLGQVIVSSPLVPLRVREGLNVEAGLNDGLSVPFLLFFMAMNGLAEGGDRAGLVEFMIEQLGYGAIVGAAIGLLGGFVIRAAQRAKWMEPALEQSAVVALPLLCIVAAEEVGASMFIASFVAGLAVQVGFKDVGRHSTEFSEAWGRLLNLGVFFYFGIIAARTAPQFQASHVAYAIISLTVVRMLPVAIALLGTRVSASTVAFMGWFGPRGLASIVLGIVYFQSAQHQPGHEAIVLAVIVTVAMSILAHGATAAPGLRWYAARVARLSPEAPERRGADEAKA
ncbi:MAG: sodium:proton antiporter [Phycisphaerales bacterium]